MFCTTYIFCTTLMVATYIPYSYGMYHTHILWRDHARMVWLLITIMCINPNKGLIILRNGTVLLHEQNVCSFMIFDKSFQIAHMAGDTLSSSVIIY